MASIKNIKRIKRQNGHKDMIYSPENLLTGTKHSSNNGTFHATHENVERRTNHMEQSCAQLKAKLKIREDDNEELKSEVQEMASKYDTLLLRYSQLEKERDMSKEQLSECLTELKTNKAHNVQMQEQMARNIKKYNELYHALSASKNELLEKIADLCHQNDDLETTLVMVRNSWNETGNVLANEVKASHSKVERLNKVVNDIQSKYESMQVEFKMQEKIIENLQEQQQQQQQRTQMDNDMNQFKSKCTAESMELHGRLNRIRDWLLSLLEQGVIEIESKNENKNEKHSNRYTSDIIESILQNGRVKKILLLISPQWWILILIMH